MLNLKETNDGVVEKTDNWQVSCTPVKHFLNSVAYRIDSNGKSVAYSGDMTLDRNFSLLAKNSDVILVECSYPDGKSRSGLHLIPSEIAELAADADAKKVILTHTYPVCEGRYEELINKIKEKFSGEVLVAEDFMEIEI